MTKYTELQTLRTLHTGAYSADSKEQQHSKTTEFQQQQVQQRIERWQREQELRRETQQRRRKKQKELERQQLQEQQKREQVLQQRSQTKKAYVSYLKRNLGDPNQRLTKTKRAENRQLAIVSHAELPQHSRDDENNTQERTAKWSAKASLGQNNERDQKHTKMRLRHPRSFPGSSRGVEGNETSLTKGKKKVTFQLTKYAEYSYEKNENNNSPAILPETYIVEKTTSPVKKHQSLSRRPISAPVVDEPHLIPEEVVEYDSLEEDNNSSSSSSAHSVELEEIDAMSSCSSPDKNQSWTLTLDHEPGELFRSLDLSMSLAQSYNFGEHQRRQKTQSSQACSTAVEESPQADVPPIAARNRSIAWKLSPPTQVPTTKPSRGEVKAVRNTASRLRAPAPVRREFHRQVNQKAEAKSNTNPTIVAKDTLVEKKGAGDKMYRSHMPTVTRPRHVSYSEVSLKAEEKELPIKQGHYRNINSRAMRQPHDISARRKPAKPRGASRKQESHNTKAVLSKLAAEEQLLLASLEKLDIRLDHCRSHTTNHAAVKPRIPPTPQVETPEHQFAARSPKTTSPCQNSRQPLSLPVSNVKPKKQALAHSARVRSSGGVGARKTPTLTTQEEKLEGRKKLAQLLQLNYK